MIDDDCGAIGGMRIGRRNRNTRRKPAPVPICLPEIPADVTWAGTPTNGLSYGTANLPVKERGHLGDIGTDAKLLLEWIFLK
jgi:hypothetical protein